jgi:3-isopropylmalate/(R)-2-methylmalate dehydratase small subunit
VVAVKPFTRHSGTAVPLDRANVDTDQIIPKEHCVRVERSGFGPYLFAHWRRESGFVMDLPRYRGASILVAGANFGCGSSREHAVWAIEDAGFRVVIAPSFGDIFATNCHKVGVLPVVLDASEVRHLSRRVSAEPGTCITVDLENRVVEADRERWEFAIDPFVAECLRNGWDDIAMTLRHEADITAFETGSAAAHRAELRDAEKEAHLGRG